MKKLLLTLTLLMSALIFCFTIGAEELTVDYHYPTKLVYDESTKTMTVTYVGSGGWHEFMPVTNKDGAGEYNYDIEKFLDKYRTEIEHMEIGKFGKIQIVDIRDKDGNVTGGASLFAGMTALKSVHFAAGQRITIGNAGKGVFEGCTSLKTVWFGDDANKIEGCANFTSCNIKENDNNKERNYFPRNLFKDCTSLESVIYTENPYETVILSSTFEGCAALKTVKIGDNIKDVDAQAFEKYSFVNIKSGEAITERPSSGEKPSGGNSGTTPAVPTVEFNPEGATVWGHSTGEYEKRIIIDTYWAYYDSTKTLEFTSLTKNYNETGALSNCDDANWSEYKDVIEHIIVGDNIAKISGKSFIGYPALKDVRLGAQVAQLDNDAFKDCANLTTIWRNGKERIEGRADFSGFSRFCDALVGTNVSEIVLPEKLSTLDLNMPMTLKTAYFHTLTDELKAHAEENLYNLVNTNDPNEKYEYYVYIDPTLPLCGRRAVFSFDEATGTLNVLGAGAIDDIVNYHGGGSKNQPWFSIKQKIKHIVIGEKITSIGKYAFAGCKNVETVCLPAFDGFVIGAAAFESCENMKSVYQSGSEPIEGTIDVRNVHALESWTFAYNYLIANAVINENVAKIGNSVFSDNTNLANIYGVPGSFAEEFASKNGYSFFDIASETPKPIKCTPPETTAETTEAVSESVTEASITTDTEPVKETEEPKPNKYGVKFVKSDSIAEDVAEESSFPVIPVVIAAVAVVIIVLAVLLILKKKKKQ